MARKALLIPERLGVARNVEQGATERSSSRHKHFCSVYDRIGRIDANGLAPGCGPKLLTIGCVDDRQLTCGMNGKMGLLPDLQRYRRRIPTLAVTGLP